MTGSLIEQLAARLQIPRDAAADALEDLVEEIREELDATGTVALPGIGTLRHADGTLAFTPDDALTAAANADYTGLTSMTVGDTDALPFDVPDARPVAPAPEPPVNEDPDLEEQEDARALVPEDVEETIGEVAAALDEPLPEAAPPAAAAEEPAASGPEENLPAAAPPDQEEPPFDPPAVFPVEDVPRDIEQRLEEQDAEAADTLLATEEQPPPFAPPPEETRLETEALDDETLREEDEEHVPPSEPPLKDAEEETAVAAGTQEAAEPVPTVSDEEELATTAPQGEAPAKMMKEEAEAGAGPEEATYPEEAVAAIASSAEAEEEPDATGGSRHPTEQVPTPEASGQPEERGRSRGFALFVGAVVLLLLLIGGYFALEAMQEDATGDELPDVVQTEPLAEPPAAPEETAPQETGDEPTAQEEAPAEETQEAAPPEEAAAPETPQAIDPDQGGWTIVVASTTSRAEAEAGVERFRDRLGDRLPVSIVESSANGVTRYRVAVGQFDTRARALNQQEVLGQQLPSDAWTLSIQ